MKYLKYREKEGSKQSDKKEIIKWGKGQRKDNNYNNGITKHRVPATTKKF